MRKIWLAWLIAFLVITVLAPTSAIHGLDVGTSRTLEGLGRRYPFLQLIWVVGGIPLTTLAVLFVASGRLGKTVTQWRFLGLFIIGSLVEIVAKHFVTTPFPPNIPPVGYYRQLVIWTNIEPSTIFGWIRDFNHSPSVSHLSSSRLLRGSFPSGHVFRITYAYGLFMSFQWRLLVAGLAALCVVATGAHWIWDAVGGYVLASLFLQWAYGLSTQGGSRYA